MTNSAADIQVGNHLTVAGFNLDTIWSTLFAGAVVIILGLLVARRATSGVPSGPQLLWETVVRGSRARSRPRSVWRSRRSPYRSA